MDTKAKALRQAAALLRLATSDNAHEAAQAAARAQEIMARHEITEAMLSLDGAVAEDDEDIEDFGKREGGALYEPEGKRLQSWRARLAVVVASANGCKAYRSGMKLHLIGRPSDCETVRYLFGFLGKETERLTDKHGRGMGQTWRANFAVGVVEGIQTALKVMNQRLADELRAAATSSTALVRVNQALVKVEQKRDAVEVWTREKSGLGLRVRPSGRMRYDRDARTQGREQGERIPLNGARRALSSGA